jgi:hypothetical protein
MEKGAEGLKVGEGGLLDYLCVDEIIHWYFCSVCGVRCFGFTGDNEVVEVNIGGKEVKAWKAKSEGWVENENGYLSIMPLR